MMKHVNALLSSTSLSKWCRLNTSKMNKEIRKEFQYEKLMLLRMSGKTNTLGKILEVNYEYYNQLKYYPDELKGVEIEKILPKHIGKLYNQSMLAAYETQQFRRLNKFFRCFLRDKEGHFLPVKSIIKEIPDLKEGLSFLTVSRPDPEMTGWLKTPQVFHYARPYLFLCDDNNKIIGINKECSLKFNIDPIIIERDCEVSIKKLFPMLENEDNYSLAQSNEGLKIEPNSLRSQELTIESLVETTIEYAVEYKC